MKNKNKKQIKKRVLTAKRKTEALATHESIKTTLESEKILGKMKNGISEMYQTLVEETQNN